MTNLEQWLTAMVMGIVSHPDEIKIIQKQDEMGILFTISAHHDDLAVLIGRKGEHANALRVLLRTCGHHNNVKASLKILA